MSEVGKASASGCAPDRAWATIGTSFAAFTAEMRSDISASVGGMICAALAEYTL